MTTLFISDAEVVALADWELAIAAIRRSYSVPAAPGQAPRRTTARTAGAWLRSLTAVSPADGVMGGKVIAASARSGSMRVSYLISLFDDSTVELVALLDANSITGLRTAATSAVAADCLAPQRALRVAVLGSGFEARKHLAALMHVREVAECQVFSPRDESRRAFVEHFAEGSGLVVGPTKTPEDAVHGADLVICAARAHGERPTLMAKWLAPGTTVVSIGSTMPEQREVDTSVIGRATLIVADVVDEVVEETGDFIAAVADGQQFGNGGTRVWPLEELVCGTVAPARSGNGITLYKSVGSGQQDVAVAAALYARALERGVGTPLPVSIAPVAK